MKTFKQFQEAVPLIPVVGGVAAKKLLLPIGMTVAGALGTYLQSKKDDQSKSNDGPFSPMSDFGASLSRSKYGKGGPQKKPEGQLSNLEIIRQELQKRLKRGAEGKFRRGHSGKFQQSDADLKNKIEEIGKKIKAKKNDMNLGK